MKSVVSLIPMGIHSKIITNGLYSNYSTISMSDESLLLLELDLTLASISSKKIRSFQPQEPMQRKVQTDEARSQLQVNERSWQPCEKTCSTAVDVATKSTISYICNRVQYLAYLVCLGSPTPCNKGLDRYDSSQ